nr:hypothetical protein [Tanacetum cinerariifolium]
PGDGITTIKRRHHDIHGDGVRDSTTASGHGRIKMDLEPSTWRRGQDRIVDPITVGNKMHKAFPLPGESSYWQYKFPLPVKVVPTARRLEMPLPGVCTTIEEMMKKLPVKDRWQLH